MHYFITKDKKVTRRPHKFNAEYLDGKLTLIDQNEECYIVHHIPDGPWSYNLKRLAIISAIHGFDKAQMLNSNEADVSPPVYYSLIPIDEFWPYVQEKEYTDVTDNTDILESDPTPISATMITGPEVVSSTSVSETTSSNLDTPTSVVLESVLPPGTSDPTPLVIDMSSSTSTSSSPAASSPASKVAGAPPGGLVDTLNDAGFPTPQLLSDSENPLYRFIPPSTKNT